MKVLKFFIVLISLLFAYSLHAYDFIPLNEKINGYESKIIESKDSSKKLFQIRKKIMSHYPQLNRCIKMESLQVKKLKEQENFLTQINNSQYLLEQSQKLSKEINVHQNKLNLCKLIRHKIESYEEIIISYNEKLYQKSFVKKYDNILSNYFKVDTSSWIQPPEGYALFSFINQSTFLKNTMVFFFFFLMIYLLKLFYFFYETPKSAISNVSLWKFLYIFLIFTSIAPSYFLLLKAGFTHRDEFILIVSKKPLSYLLPFCFVCYLYFYSHFNYTKKEIFSVVLTLFLEILMIRIFFDLYYFDTHLVAESQILFYKYEALIIMQMMVFAIFYWCFYKILAIDLLKYQKIFVIIIGFESILFTLGLLGYVDMAINVNFVVISDIVILVGIIVLTRIKNILMQSFKNLNHKTALGFKKYFGNHFNDVIFNLKVILNCTYIVIVILSLASLISNIFWFNALNSVDFIYNFLFTEHTFNNLSFLPIQYLYAFQSFFILNIVNHFFSLYISRKLFQNKVYIQKTTKIFYYIGFFIICILVLMIAGFKFQNFVIMLGGLTFGIGLGLKNVLSSFLSCLILFINRPFDIGDYVEINFTKGFIKKITLLETMIETIDKNIIILPNQYVANSVIQNYSYDHKSFHRVHLKYIFEHMQPLDEEYIEKLIEKVLQEDPNVIFESSIDVECIFSPQAQLSNSTNLEVIFCFHSLNKINEYMTKLNVKILKVLKEAQLDVRFDSEINPFKEGSRSSNDRF